MTQVLIGTDPELFLKNSEGKFISGHDLIPGTKTRPHPVALGAIQVDGVALEFNTDPAATSEEFLQNIEAVIAQITLEYKKVNPDLEIAIEPTATFEEDYFSTLPDEAKELGCQPDYNAYTGKPNKKPSTKKPMRTASGHVHIGWGKFRASDEDHFQTCMKMVRQLDSLLFVSSLLWDSDKTRRELYGKIGAFRPKSYGVEYRPMSNRWLSHVSIQEFVFEATQKAAMDFLEGIYYEEDPKIKDMIDSIHSGYDPDEDLIRQYLRHLNSEFGTPLFI